MTLTNFLLTLGVTLWAAYGTYLLKANHFVAGMLVYGSTAFFWHPILKDTRLVTIAAVYGVISVIADVFSGVVFFHETPKPNEVVGTVLGLIAIVIMLWPGEVKP